MRILQIGADRSKQGVLFPGTPAHKRQAAYAARLGNLDIIGFSRRSDGAIPIDDGALRIYPTNSTSRWSYIRDALRIARTLPKPDVVSAQDPHDCGLAALWIAHKRRVPLHVQVHADIFSTEYASHSVLNFLRLHIALYVLKRADGIRVVSQRIKDSIELRLKPKREIAVLPIFVDLERFRSATASYEQAARYISFSNRLLVVSRLEPEKNIALAIQSFADSAPETACLIIVGDGSERHALEDAARDARVFNRVFFVGAQDPAPYYALADLVLVTSKYEGYGLVIVEALAARKPVLSTDVGVAGEAGAIVSFEADFGKSLKKWFVDGPKTGELRGYPYQSMEEYVRMYCDDITKCVAVK